MCRTMSSSSFCCDHERDGLLETIRALPSLGWYYGNITVEQAEVILKNEPNGAFLIRDSSDSDNIRDIFTVTFKIRNCYGSVRIDYAKGFFSLSLQDPGLPLFPTLMGLVHYCLERSVVHKQPVCILTGHSQNNNVSLYLTKLVSRHHRIHSLMHLCRGALHKSVTADKLTQLGLPIPLVKYYLVNNPYFDDGIEYNEISTTTESQPDRLSQQSSNSLHVDTAGNGSDGRNNNIDRS
jgi:hypothetical protein